MGPSPTKKPRICGAFLSGRPDSNRGPRRPERRALPGCATPRRRLQYPTQPAEAPSRRSRAHLTSLSGYARPMPCQLQDAIAELDQLLQPSALQGLLPQRPPVPRQKRDQEARHRRQRKRRAVRAGDRRPSRPAPGPPRALLGLDRHTHRPPYEAPSEAALRLGHEPRRLPPSARRPPRSRQQRADRPCPRRRQTRALRRARRRADRLHRDASPTKA